jgi:hypothetical protein
MGDRVKELLEDIKVAMPLHDPENYVDGCRCDSDVGCVCEMCFTHACLSSARRVIIQQQGEIEQLKKDNSALASGYDCVAYVNEIHEFQANEIASLKKELKEFREGAEAVRAYEGAALLPGLNVWVIRNGTIVQLTVDRVISDSRVIMTNDMAFSARRLFTSLDAAEAWWNYNSPSRKDAKATMRRKLQRQTRSRRITKRRARMEKLSVSKESENWRSHTLLQPKDCNCKDREYPRCPICDDGLAYCVVCKGGESELLDQSCKERQDTRKGIG